MPRPRKVTDEALKDELDREKLRELQLRNDEREGILVIAAEVDSRWTQFLADLRTHLEALPARLAGSVETPPPVLSALRERIEEIVEDLGATKAKRTRKPRAKATDAPSVNRRTPTGKYAKIGPRR